MKIRKNERFLNCLVYFRPKEFIECVGYVRMLSWLLLGSLNSFRLTASFPSSAANYRNAQQAGPIPSVLKSLPPLECNAHIAEYILVLLTGFMEHNSAKSSILTMSALFHAFICCQVRPFLKKGG